MNYLLTTIAIWKKLNINMLNLKITLQIVCISIGGFMESLIQIFDKMNSKTKNQLIIIMIGLLMPSLVYLTLNFPIYMYKGDLLKIIIMGICINFSIICILVLISIFSKLIGYKEHIKFINISSENISKHLNELKEKNKQLKIKVIQSELTIDEEEIKELDSEMSHIENEISMIEKSQTELLAYLENLLNPYKYLSEVSAILILYVLLISIFNIILPYEIEFSVLGIFKNIFPFILSYFGLAFLVYRYYKDPEFIHLINNLKSYKIYP